MIQFLKHILITDHAMIGHMANVVNIILIVRGITAIIVFSNLSYPVLVYGLMFALDATTNDSYATYLNAAKIIGLSILLPYLPNLVTVVTIRRRRVDLNNIFLHLNLFEASDLWQVDFSLSFALPFDISCSGYPLLLGCADLFYLGALVAQ